MIIRDSITVDASGLKMTRDGYLTGEARVSRSGNVQKYYGSEIGLTGDDASKVFGVYRDPAVVFAESSMMTLAGRPVTRGHPPAGVTADNWKDLSVGQVGGIIKRDGEHVVAPMAIMDASAAKEVASGARSLSAGYIVGITKDEGISPSGEPYQYRQSGELRFNHVAYLPDNNPRAGNTRIGDSWGAAPINDNEPTQPGTPPKSQKGGHMTTKTVVLGDRAVQVLAEDAAEVEAFKTATAKAIADAQSTHDAAIAAKDAELAKLQAKLDDATGKILSDADLDAKVSARAELVSVAKSIAPEVKTEGVKDADIRKAVVTAKLGDSAIADKSAAYIDARFDILAEDAKPTDPVAGAFRQGIKTDDAAINDAHNSYVARLTRKTKEA